jgi:outer membrane protein assembly factor BamB
MNGMVAAVLYAARSLMGSGRRALAALTVVVLAVSACASSPTRTLITSAPVDSGLSLYAKSSDGALTAYRASDGVKRWTYTPKTRYLCASGGPFYHAGVVFCFTSTKDIYHTMLTAIRATDGQFLWTLPVSGDPPVDAMAGDDIALLVPADVLTGSPSSLLVVRIADGVPIRSIPLPSPEVSYFTADGDTAYFCPPNGALYAYRLSDGKMLWQDPIATASKSAPSGEPAEHFCSPAATEGVVYTVVEINPLNSSDIQATLFAARESDGRILWRQPVTTVSMLSVRDGIVFISGEKHSIGKASAMHTLIALRASDGATLWRIPDARSVTEAGGVVTFVQGNTLRAVSAADGAALWQRQAPRYQGYGGAVSVSNVVFVESNVQASIHDLPPLGSDTTPYLFALSATDGSVYWQIPFDGLWAILSVDA